MNRLFIIIVLLFAFTCADNPQSVGTIVAQTKQTKTAKSKAASNKTTPQAPTKKNNTSAQSQKKQTNGSKGGTKPNSAAQSKGTTQSKGATQQSKGTTQKKKGSNKSAKKQPVETSADVKRQQQAAQQDIQTTKEQIKENEAKVKKNLSELSRIGTDIDASKTQASTIAAQVSRLQNNIGELESEIEANETELQRLREKYLDAIKKVRAGKKRNSQLAFIFSSKNLNQAMRRMRYLSQFSDWRKNQSAELDRRVELLRNQQDTLAAARRAQEIALQRQRQTQHRLESQYARQDSVVAELRQNGQALRTHLEHKQAEANALGNRVAQLIAQEQARAKAEAEAKAKAEAEAKAKAKAEAEARAKAKAEAEAKAKAEQEQKLAQANAAKNNSKTPKKDEAAKANSKKDTKTDKNNKDNKKTEPRKSEGQYAAARKRKSHNDKSDRNDAAKPTASVATASTATASSSPNGNFEKMKGQLPRPVSGAFRVISPFGRHPYPGLPDVMYDNLGIDVEVNPGAQVKAVYGGKVSAVFIMPDYQTVVMVNHGNYVTVYGHIGTAAVKSGDTVTQGQALGSLVKDEDGGKHSTLHFEVWKNRETQNPMHWIK